MINLNTKRLGRINLLDTVVVLAILIGVVGIFLVQSNFHVTSGQEVKGDSDIQISIAIPNLQTLDKNLFVPGQKTSITIRNQPRGEVLIQTVTVNPIKVAFLGSGEKAVSVTDVSQPNNYNFQLILKDHATVTKEGYVTDGVKVKVGLPIELEGFKYRVFGKIVNVEPVSK